jgi:hypothetical protein
MSSFTMILVRIAGSENLLARCQFVAQGSFRQNVVVRLEYAPEKFAQRAEMPVRAAFTGSLALPRRRAIATQLLAKQSRLLGD